MGIGADKFRQLEAEGWRITVLRDAVYFSDTGEPVPACPHPQAAAVKVTEDALNIALTDGRMLSVPLWWFPRLLGASSEERARFEVHECGLGIHWPELDEDISVRGCLVGGPARRAKAPDSR